MINLGLRDAKLQQLINLLQSPHWIKVTLQILDMDHNILEDVSHMLMSGQVDFDTSREVYRSLELELSDPESKMKLNPNSPEEGAVFINRMVKVIYSVAPPAPTVWYDIPLFVGPIGGMSRDNNIVKISAVGKDSLGLTGIWEGKTFKKNRKLTEIIEDVLRLLLGETRFNVPDRARRTDKQVVVGTSVVPLKLLRKFARSLDLFMLWDGRGICQVRKLASGVLHTYSDRNLTSEITFTYDPTTLVNAVKVVGGKPKGKKNKVSARAVAPDGHPLSPKSLGRKIKDDEGNEKIIPRYYPVVIEDSSLKTDKACKKRAQEVLKRGLEESLNIEFSCIPNPLMEEGDLFLVKTDDVNMQTRAVQWSIPLTHDGQMSVGVIKKVSFKTRKKGSAKGKHKGRSGRGRRGGRRG